MNIFKAWEFSNATEKKIFNDLFFEQSLEINASSYRHGILRSIFILTRSLVISPKVLDLRKEICSETSIAFTFFKNEYYSIKNASSDKINIDSIIKIDMHKMSFLRDELGWFGLISEFGNFVKAVIATRGAGHLPRITHPFLAWLLYKSLTSILGCRKNVNVVATNMTHPLSISVAWACLSTGHFVDYWEHAATPRIFFHDRGYRHFYVNLQHTKDMFCSNGVDRSRVTVLHSALKFPQAVNSISKNIFNVGICINILDSVEAVSVITSVVLKLGLKPTYRIHDADPRCKEFKKIAAKKNIKLSLARESRIELFLTKMDLVVAGNSNVVSDSLLSGKPVVYFWDGKPDWYDFYGLISYFKIPSAGNADELEFEIVKLQQSKLRDHNVV